MNKVGKWILGLSIVGVVVGFAYKVMTEAKKLADFCYDFGGYKLTGLSLNEITMDIIVRIKNKSNVNVVLSGYNFKVFVNGTFISRVMGNKPQPIFAGKKEPIVLGIVFDPREVLKGLFTVNNLVTAGLDQSKIIVKVSGYFSVNVGGVKVDNFPKEMESSLADMLKPDPNKQPCE